MGNLLFRLPFFHAVNKIMIAIDLIAALQSQQARLTITPNTATKSSSVLINTADAGAYKIAAEDGSGVSGRIELRTGTSSTGNSGAISIKTGAASGGAGGDINLSCWCW